MGKQLARYGMFHENDSLTNYLTTGAAYVDVGKVSMAFIKTLTFLFTATTNNLVVNLLGTLDGTNYDVTVEADIAVNVGTPVKKTYIVGASSHPYLVGIKVQVKPAVGGNNGTLATKWACASV